MIPLSAPVSGFLYLAGTVFILAFFIFPEQLSARRHS